MKGGLEENHYGLVLDHVENGTYARWNRWCYAEPESIMIHYRQTDNHFSYIGVTPGIRTAVQSEDLKIFWCRKIQTMIVWVLSTYGSDRKAHRGSSRSQTSADRAVRILSGITVRCLSVKIWNFQSGGFSSVRISNVNLILADILHNTPHSSSGQNPYSAVRRRRTVFPDWVTLFMISLQ